MSLQDVYRRVLEDAARAAYDDRPVTSLSQIELATWQEAQARFHRRGRQRENLADALAHLEQRRATGHIDEAFFCSAACVLHCDTDINDLDAARRMAARQEAAAEALHPGPRRRQMMAGAHRHRATIARREGQPAAALELDRRAFELTAHPRDFANVLIDLLRQGDLAAARSTWIETQLTASDAFVAQLERIVSDDIDLAWFREV
jgi:hypothetical protein